MAIITLAQVKTQLGLSDTTYDAQITAKLPIIDSKVKLITKNNWNKRIYGDTTDASANITLYEDYTLSVKNYGYILEWVLPGSQITGTGIPTGAYITDIYAEGTEDNENYPMVTISDNCTATASGIEMYLGFPIGYHDIVAKGIWFLIDGTSTTLPTNSATSESMGPASVSYSDADNKLDGISGMPMWFVKSLPRYGSGM